MVIKQIPQFKMQKNENFQKILMNSVIVRIYSLGSSEESPRAGETDRRGGLGLLVTIYEAYISYVSYINTT